MSSSDRYAPARPTSHGGPCSGAEPSWAPGQPACWRSTVCSESQASEEHSTGHRLVRTGSGVPTDMPVTQWFNDQVQEVDAASWRLRSSDGARSYSVEDLVAFDDALRATLDCTGGWYAEQVWRGARLDRLLDGADGEYHSRRIDTGYSPRSRAQTLPSSSWRRTSATLRYRPGTALPYVWSRPAAADSGG